MRAETLAVVCRASQIPQQRRRRQAEPRVRVRMFPRHSMISIRAFDDFIWVIFYRFKAFEDFKSDLLTISRRIVSLVE